MLVGEFSVSIPEGNENADGYVFMEHNTQYSITLQSLSPLRCDAEITIDNKVVGTWRLESFQTATLERGVNDNGRFTFYAAGTQEASRAKLGNVSRYDLGVIQVKFTPEKEYPKYTKAKRSGGPCGQSIDSYGYMMFAANAGGTGLSGKSNQEFSHANNIQYDASKEVTINLRLVTNNNGPRPLVGITKSNPVPKPV